MREIRLYDGIADFFDGLTCPALEKFELDSDTRDIYGHSARVDLDDECAQALGSFLHRSGPPNFVFHLGAQFPSTFLNGIFHASCSAIKVSNLRSPESLSLESCEDGTRLVIPSSVQLIEGPGRVSKEEMAAWTQKLELCLDAPPNQALKVIFGPYELDVR
ncbi:hypothetical protein BKA70DRAFT_1279061 [Coprinopsis sp. MPI-PUGE-AT-0042]|nr:hypothetical protein BKA70DRAFT_1279061 [Coprinopsis sp. MPI-PUGE-AT-0042]